MKLLDTLKEYQKDPNLKPKDEMMSPDVLKNMGSLDSKKYLYESGLQNVYNDYKQNIDILDQNKKNQLQQAYFQNQMAKKYLGEYASNNEIGDVSGSLLDMYGSYQNNLADINANADVLEMNLTKEYQDARLNGLTKIMETQLEMDVENMEQSARDILYEITMGELNGMSEMDYLENAYANGRIDDNSYKQLKLALYQENSQKILDRFESGNYGYKTNEDGERVKITDPNEYLESIKDTINERDYNNIKDLLQDQESNKIDFVDIRSEFGANFNPKQYVKEDVNVGRDSDAFRIDGTEYYQILDSVENDTWVDEANITSEDLFDVAGEGVVNREVISHKGMFFEYKDGKWYRLTSAKGTEQFKEFQGGMFSEGGFVIGNKKETSSQRIGQDEDGNDLYVDYDRNGKNRDTITFYKEVKNEETGKIERKHVGEIVQSDAEHSFKLKSKEIRDPELLSIQKEFKKIEADRGFYKNESIVIFRNGSYWQYDHKNKKVYRMRVIS